MYRSILFVQAVSLARSTVLGATIVAAAITAAVAAGPQVGGDFMPIHTDNQKAGSQIVAYWQAQTAAGTDTTVANEKPLWERRTDSAYLAVFQHYCDPGMRNHLAMAVEPSSVEIALYTDRLRVEYVSDCRAFYLNEIAGRLDRSIE